MGLGAPRQEDQAVEARPLSDEANRALREALTQLDGVNESFRESRDLERDSQLLKLWNRKSKEVVAILRGVAKTMIDSHQLSLEMGSTGGGRNIRPWLEESSQAIDRLEFVLDDYEVVAKVGDQEVLRGPIDRVGYEWVEEAVVNWVLAAVDQKLR